MNGGDAPGRWVTRDLDDAAVRLFDLDPAGNRREPIAQGRPGQRSDARRKRAADTVARRRGGILDQVDQQAAALENLWIVRQSRDRLIVDRVLLGGHGDHCPARGRADTGRRADFLDGRHGLLTAQHAGRQAGCQQIVDALVFSRPGLELKHKPGGQHRFSAGGEGGGDRTLFSGVAVERQPNSLGSGGLGNVQAGLPVCHAGSGNRGHASQRKRDVSLQLTFSQPNGLDWQSGALRNMYRRARCCGSRFLKRTSGIVGGESRSIPRSRSP
jgi:hypothetical protein